MIGYRSGHYAVSPIGTAPSTNAPHRDVTRWHFQIEADTIIIVIVIIIIAIVFVLIGEPPSAAFLMLSFTRSQGLRQCGTRAGLVAIAPRRRRQSRLGWRQNRLNQMDTARGGSVAAAALHTASIPTDVWRALLYADDGNNSSSKWCRTRYCRRKRRTVIAVVDVVVCSKDQ